MADKKLIKKLREDGYSYGYIAREVGLSRQRIYQIISGKQTPRISKKTWELRLSIFKRDSLTCQWGKLCKKGELTKKELVLHHIDFNNKNNSEENLITLCRKCHSKFHFKNHINNKIEKNMTRPKLKITKSKYVSMSMEPKLYAQLKKYAERNNNGIVSMTARDAIQKFISEELN